jgi:hypothetical protein
MRGTRVNAIHPAGFDASHDVYTEPNTIVDRFRDTIATYYLLSVEVAANALTRHASPGGFKEVGNI